MASKVQERIFLEGFLQMYQSDLTLVSERESPDFLLRDRMGEIGLEVTQVFRNTGKAGSPTKAGESRRVKFLRGLASMYYKARGLPLLLKASLPDRPKFDMPALIKRLQVERGGEPWSRTRFTLNASTKFHLTALPAEAGAYNRWLCINKSLGWVSSLHADLLSQRIQAKAAKIPFYLKAASRVALLLVVDRTSGSGMLEWRENEPSPHSEGFDMVYLYIYPVEAVRLA